MGASIRTCYWRTAQQNVHTCHAYDIYDTPPLLPIQVFRRDSRPTSVPFRQKDNVNVHLSLGLRFHAIRRVRVITWTRDRLRRR